MFKSKEELIKEKHELEFCDMIPWTGSPDAKNGYELGVQIGIKDAFQSFAERVEFYKKYRNDQKAFKKDFPDIHLGFREFVNETDIPVSYFRFYREFLFDFCFGDVK